MTRTSVTSGRHLAEVGVEVHHAVAELLHVLRQELVCIGYPIIQVSHFVVGESPEAERVVLGDRKDGSKWEPPIRGLQLPATHCRYSSYSLFVSRSRNLSFSSFRPNFKKLFTKAIWNESVEQHSDSSGLQVFNNRNLTIQTYVQFLM